MMNIIQQVIDPMATNLSLLILLHYYCYHHCYTCYKLLLSLLLLPLLLSLLSKLSNYFATDHFVADNQSLGVFELTTRLLIPSNILWLPLCRIYKFGLNTYPRKLLRSPILVGYQDLFLAPLPGSIAIFVESFGSIISPESSEAG